MPTAPADVETYLASLPDDVRPVVAEIRRRIAAAVPDAGETISYAMPGMTLGGKVFVHFAGWKKHVSVYPVPDTADDADLAAAIAPYAGPKGTLKFPLARPVPFDVIERVAVRLAERCGRRVT